MSPALRLWSLPDLTLASSVYAIDEAERNLNAADTRARLYRLIQQIEIADEPPATVTLPNRLRLVQKDQPILRGAIHAKCSHLLEPAEGIAVGLPFGDDHLSPSLLCDLSDADRRYLEDQEASFTERFRETIGRHRRSYTSCGS